MTYDVPCTDCGQPYFQYVASTQPSDIKPWDQINIPRDFAHIDGRPIIRHETAHCDSCGDGNPALADRSRWLPRITA